MKLKTDLYLEESLEEEFLLPSNISLQLIAKEINELDDWWYLVKFFSSCGIPVELIESYYIKGIYKAQIIYDILLKLITSQEEEDRETFFKIFSRLYDPKEYNDLRVATAFKNRLNKILSIDNLALNKNSFKKLNTSTSGFVNENSIEENHSLPEERFHRIVWDILKRIKETILFFGCIDGVIPYSCKEKERLSDLWIEEERVIYRLKDLDILKSFQIDGIEKGLHKIVLNWDIFEKVYELYKNGTAYIDIENGQLSLRNKQIPDESHLSISKVEALEKVNKISKLVLGNFVLDLDRVTLSYKDISQKHIEINTIPFKFFRLLMEKKGNEATVEDIKRTIYEGQNISNDDVKNRIASIKQLLGKELLKAGFPPNYVLEIKKSIKPVINGGYKLVV